MAPSGSLRRQIREVSLGIVWFRAVTGAELGVGVLASDRC
jgi:hypothetical protein